MSTNISVNRICEQCGKAFIARTTVTRFCSHTCNSRNYKQRVQRSKIAASDSEVILAKSDAILNQPREFLTVKQASRLLQCSERILYQQIQTGRIKAISLSQRKTLIKRKHLDKIFKQPEFQVQSKNIKKKNPAIVYCFNMSEAQKYYGISETALSDLIKRNDIEVFKQGKHSYVLRTALHQVFHKNK